MPKKRRRCKTTLADSKLLEIPQWQKDRREEFKDVFIARNLAKKVLSDPSLNYTSIDKIVYFLQLAKKQLVLQDRIQGWMNSGVEVSGKTLAQYLIKHDLIDINKLNHSYYITQKEK